MESSDDDDGPDKNLKRRERQKNSKRRRRRYEDSSSSSEHSERSRKRSRRHKKEEKKRRKKKRKKDRKRTKKQESAIKSQLGDASDQKMILGPNVASDPSKPTSASATNEKEVRKLGESESVARERVETTRKKSQQMAPMSREQYETLQSTIREVFDEESGRYRLVRGTGEIIERIVSRSEHHAINQQATRGDGQSFSRHIMNARKGVKR